MINVVRRFSFLPFLFVATFAACGGQGGEEGQAPDGLVPGQAPAAQREERLTTTIVRLNPDGTQSVSVFNTTAAQHQREQAIRDQIANGTLDPNELERSISIDGSCLAASMWMYDAVGFGGNRLCLTGSGQAVLAGYARSPGTWDRAVRSYSAGANPGLFAADHRNCCANSEFFSTYGSQYTADSTIQNASYITIVAGGLGPFCINTGFGGC